MLNSRLQKELKSKAILNAHLFWLKNQASKQTDLVFVDDFFASDEFVRGHYFHGKKVLKFSEARQKYDDFIILLSFASWRHSSSVSGVMWKVLE